ncbi:ectoine/hydroxyectoine ABC transporter substrate-binding protein EhuB [Prauserella sp. PE36]|uniref:Ectoine/hydroxyectoine ABC transporter substrate-binding protein EhuB n=1 Tax=Prauserella endophytica TaxID=1592324 RepID=A0ABY2RYV6_9PSEU|nr:MULTISPECIES: ectoine/hydroxyectoine ABC transporter substrate-binding protein EhuB [Prauserella]PXY26771.1 ectoine/hydroxyectoine ABC transporter substrate-binding protein EhuB [Prauserella coralliicola]RBM16579.1 ectoine/hydroxyectoine ABC transporter substrate-binding protein EhuB [Prauserella sp. PE36]TKG66174.1 ectoine/hydroxyectoine ABC transporter substrate-binding protein EhuB [Prauserella endophytica]
MAHSEWTRREFFRRSAVIGAAAIGGPTLLSACAGTGDGDTLQSARDSGMIRIGIANEQPYGFADASGKVTGEAPEVARAVFNAMGIRNVQNSVVTFDQLIPALNARQYDVVSAGMFITPERCNAALFSTPDYTALAALLVPRGNPQQVKNFEDLAQKNVKVAVLSGAVEKGYATAAGVSEDNITTLDTQDSMLRSVIDDRVYCAALTDISLKWLVKQNPDAPVEVTESFQPEEDGKPVISAGGFVFRQGDESLRDAFNEQLKKLHDSGEWVRIVEPFGFGEVNLPKPDVTTESLCGA